VNFSDLGIETDMVEALEAKGIIEPFPIQEQTIPIALTGQDIIGQAKNRHRQNLRVWLAPDPVPGR